MSLSVVGGLGAILGVFFELYVPQGHTSAQVVWLGTFPSLFVGVGKFFSSFMLQLSDRNLSR
jgi:hypothetical protein